ncbi:MAG TPA: VWA domain-containing protein [Bryobacteraceae bacterium]|jgi:VWFA-related protein|nr:VWA domain-containing protein [Bryobacteraceae bacterium]
MVRRKITGLACNLLLWAPLALRGQVSIEPRPRPAPIEDKSPKANIRVDTNLVLVPVTVCNPYNQPVTGLEKEHFKIFDDKVEQTITHFSMDDEPVSVGLVFDVSGSMGNKLRESRLAAAEFFKTANRDDDFFLVEFSDIPKLISPLGSAIPDIQNELTFSPSKGRTALLDAVFLAMHEMKKSQKNRKALLIISDGGDNASRYTETELRNLVRESDVMIYAIGVYESASVRSRTPEEAGGPGLLSDLCEQTGGRHFPADVTELPDIAAKIGVELRNRYVLGYIPTAQQHDGRYHPVTVKVIPPHGLPPLRAFWRRGYYAPSN